MTKELCPVCGCTIVGGGYEKDGVRYCCEPCADSKGPCKCGCCHPVEEEKNNIKPVKTKPSQGVLHA